MQGSIGTMMNSEQNMTQQKLCDHFRELKAESQCAAWVLSEGRLECSSMVKLLSSMHKTLCSIQNNREAQTVPDVGWILFPVLPVTARTVLEERQTLVSPPKGIFDDDMCWLLQLKHLSSTSEPHFKVYKLPLWKLRGPWHVHYSFV